MINFRCHHLNKLVYYAAHEETSMTLVEKHIQEVVQIHSDCKETTALHTLINFLIF